MSDIDHDWDCRSLQMGDLCDCTRKSRIDWKTRAEQAEKQLAIAQADLDNAKFQHEFLAVKHQEAEKQLAEVRAQLDHIKKHGRVGTLAHIKAELAAKDAELAEVQRLADDEHHELEMQLAAKDAALAAQVDTNVKLGLTLQPLQAELAAKDARIKELEEAFEAGD